MRRSPCMAWITVALILLAGCSPTPAPTTVPAVTLAAPSQPPDPTALPATSVPTSTPDPTPTPADPQTLISQQSLLGFIADLTAIQPYSGWRNSATEGEAQSLDYVTEKLAQLEFLQDLGLDLERQEFRVFLGTELWENRLFLTVGENEVEVPASALRGPRDEVAQALRFDSDGRLNDADSNPVVRQGPVVLARSAKEIQALDAVFLRDKIVFLDFAVIDRTIVGRQEAAGIASNLLAKRPAGLVLVTRFSSRPFESHGTFVGDLSALDAVYDQPMPPTLYARLEDLAPAGIGGWDDLARVSSARMSWDADVFSPADSGNLIAHIPGQNPSRAVILGAHIDSPNSPGALDNGSGSAILLEVARALNEARLQPATDLYLAWFGSEELGYYGSSHFVATHQELLDRTVAMLQIDCLTRPLDGIEGYLNLITWSYGGYGDGRLTWPDFLQAAAGRLGITASPVDYHGRESDNTLFSAFDVPNANLIFMNYPEMAQAGDFWQAGHVHNPYDTVELAAEMSEELEQMTRVALAAAIETGQAPNLRVAPAPERRALFVASHTESAHMHPALLVDLGMTLSWEGYDVDMIPYGQAVTADELQDAAMVVVLPVYDYPSPEGDVGLYDEAWSEQEIEALEQYVVAGGLLILTNSAHRLKYDNLAWDPNEDWDDANAVAGRFGVTFLEGPWTGNAAWTTAGSTLLAGVSSLEMASNNGVPFRLAAGEVLAWVGNEPAAAMLTYGRQGGQVLVLADVTILAAGLNGPTNRPFWQNLARQAWSRVAR